MTKRWCVSELVAPECFMFFMQTLDYIPNFLDIYVLFTTMFDSMPVLVYISTDMCKLCTNMDDCKIDMAYQNV